MHISNLTFLAVEDHEFQRIALMSMLEALGATTVLDAPGGRAALTMMEKRGSPVDIVISDLDMPDMDGMEFMRHLSQAETPVTVIIASAVNSSLLASVETMTKAYGVNVLGVIEKPITPAKLEALIALHVQAQPNPATPASGEPTFTLAQIADGLRNDEFEPFFQPKVELATGRIKGAEALARWRHRDTGIVTPPSGFMDAIENGGPIDALTWIMLRKAAAFCSKWRAASGMDVTMSVNLSIKSLTDPLLAERVTELVRHENVEPQHMVIELTESAATTQVAQALENLSRLRLRGFGLSIDDYGTGYSSMQQLTRIAFTEIKIDQSFVAHAASQRSARVILESSLDMARKLNVTSVAEGVETQQHWGLLRLLGCSLAQGYFIAKPMEAEAFLQWARRQT